jgi:hypothetical protein
LLDEKSFPAAHIRIRAIEAIIKKEPGTRLFFDAYFGSLEI